MIIELQLAIELLLIASLVAMVVKYIDLPYTVALVIVGLLLSLSREYLHATIPGGESLGLSKDLVFLIFLPPLLFEGAINMDLEVLRRNKLYVALLAFVGTLLTCLFFGFSLSMAFGFSLVPGLLMGSMLAPTDPVSVLALFKEHGVNKDLSTIVEGESVFNDGLGVVLFLVFLEAITHPGQVSVGTGLSKLIVEVCLAAFIGMAGGFFVHKLLGKIDDDLTEVTISLVLAYGVYILADRMHASGVIAVVCAGLIIGNYGKLFSMSPTTRLTLTSFWEVAAFLINSLLFLLIGIAFHPEDLVKNWKLVLILFVMLLVFRSIVTYGMFALIKIFRKVPPMNWQHVINWGGLRGSIPIALALGLPREFTMTMGQEVITRQDIISVVFGVVLLSLLLQGLSIKYVLRFLGLTHLSEEPLMYEHLLGQVIGLKSARETLKNLHQKGEVSQHTFDMLMKKLDTETNDQTHKLKEFVSAHQEIYDSEYDTIARSLLLSQRAAMQEAFHRGIISDHVAADLIREIDSELSEDAVRQDSGMDHDE